MNFIQLQEVLKQCKSSIKVAQFYKKAKAMDFPLEVARVESPFLAILAVLLADIAPVLLVCPTMMEAETAKRDLETWISGEDNVPVFTLPWWQTGAYRPLHPSSAVFGHRSACLANIVSSEKSITVVSLRAFLGKLPPLSNFSSNILQLEVGLSCTPDKLATMAARIGYCRVPSVSLAGEFAQKGEIVDFYRPYEELADRVIFDFDKIERINSFDPTTQITVKAQNKLTLCPLKEVIWDEENIKALWNNLTQQDRSEQAQLLAQLANKKECLGEEVLFPMAFNNTASILDYMPDNTQVLYMDYERLIIQEEIFRKEYETAYRSQKTDFFAPAPDRLLHCFEVLEKSRSSIIKCFRLKDSSNTARIDFYSEAPRSFFGNLQLLKEQLHSLLADFYTVIIFTETSIQAERLAILLKELAVGFIVAPISAGFTLPEDKLVLIQENEIFGRRKKIPKSVKSVRTATVDVFIDLSPGDLIVHLNYGIGKFVMLERKTVSNLDRDYIKLEYADNEVVFVPIEQANLIQRYIGSSRVKDIEGSTSGSNKSQVPAVRLDKIGSKSWESRKEKTRTSIGILAEKLIRIYSHRRLAKGYSFPPDSEWQLGFEASFPYEETEDQLRCIEEVKADMESKLPMDRLICGDVGYGKTEIAMRTAFKAASAGKQVAFLAPTTILVEQHYENFKERIGSYPLRIAMLSRFVDRSEQQKIIQDLRQGKVDIVVGTQRILQKDIVFKDLGLLIIDEEQRFGVKDKERLKDIKANIDCLALTATPIPRTLHMSLAKIRDLSILNSAPKNRQPIQTIVQEFNPDMIRSAIIKEIERGGQIFYLHNRIDSLEEVARFLSDLVPEAFSRCAHGRLDAAELEDIMHDFIRGGFQILISTTIIENGIDIPNVNTIIIDRADAYGISQLYQLKGRVGRSDKPAYAYLFYPDKRNISDITLKRLQVISDFTELGSGFKIAMKDMEVRGAGNLLGREQSGDISSVGFELYLKLLDEAVHSLMDAGFEPAKEPYLELEYSGYIPNEYISNQTIKMEVYKKLASNYHEADLEHLHQELLDRFGPVPHEVESLIALAGIRIICRSLGVSSLVERGKEIKIEFAQVAKISIEKMLRVFRENQSRIRLDPKIPNAIFIRSENIGLKEKCDFLREVLAPLTRD